MMDRDDRLVFAEEVAAKMEGTDKFWKILIVDDEQEVHIVTKLVLGDLEFKGRTLYFISAYSGKDAIKRIEENPDAALVLLDVVMEEEDSGLKVVRYIRETMKNQSVRIILRTGQPGQAPEDKVIIEYDINDYKEKTELSYKKLLASVISSLRTFNDIQTIVRLNNELEEKVRMRTVELEKANMQLKRSLSKLKADQVAGRKIQNKLLPDLNRTIKDFEFSRILFPSMYLSGDFIDYFEIDDKHIGFYIADVSGHGASSAFVTVLLKSIINNYLDKNRLEHDEAVLKPGVFLKKLNDDFLKENLGKYLTIFYGVLDCEKNKMHFSNGGQFPLPLLFDGQKTIFITSRGVPIGLFPFSDFEEKSMDLPEEFVFLLASDGILEFIPHKELDEKLHVLSLQVADMDSSIHRIINKLEIKDSESLPDDITFLMIKRKK